jgi:hypothetical protein
VCAGGGGASFASPALTDTVAQMRPRLRHGNGVAISPWNSWLSRLTFSLRIRDNSSSAFGYQRSSLV